MGTGRVIAVSWREGGDDQDQAIRLIWKKLSAAEVDGVVKQRVESLDAVVQAVRAVGGESVELDIIGHAKPGRICVGGDVVSPARESYKALAGLAGRVRHVRLLGCHVGLAGAPSAEEAGPVLQLALSHFLGVPVSAALGPVFDYHFDSSGLSDANAARLSELKLSGWVCLDTPYNGVGRSEHPPAHTTHEHTGE